MKTRMQWFRFFVLSILLTIPVILGLAVCPALALEDVLLMPAMKTDKAPNSLLTDVSRAGDRLVAVGVNGHIIYSDNDGIKWIQAEVPVRVNLTAVTFVTALKGWASGHSGVVLQTEDGGKTWKKQLDGAIASKTILASAKQRVARLKVAVAAAEDDAREDLSYQLETAEWLLEDAQRDVAVGPAKPIMDLWFKNDQEGFAVGAYGYFLHTSDGGNTWEDYAPRIENPDSLHLYAVNCMNGNVVFVVGEEGSIFRSKDGGVTWEKLDSPYSGGFFGVFGTDEAGQVCVFGLKGNIFYSEDFGDNWEKVATNSGASLFNGLILKDKRRVFVGQGGTVLVCEENFKACRVVPRKDRKILSAAVPTGNDRMIVVGMGGVEVFPLVQ